MIQLPVPYEQQHIHAEVRTRRGVLKIYWVEAGTRVYTWGRRPHPKKPGQTIRAVVRCANETKQRETRYFVQPVRPAYPTRLHRRHDPPTPFYPPAEEFQKIWQELDIN
jgi:hypothetical protein